MLKRIKLSVTITVEDIENGIPNISKNPLSLAYNRALHENNLNAELLVCGKKARSIYTGYLPGCNDTLRYIVNDLNYTVGWLAKQIQNSIQIHESYIFSYFLKSKQTGKNMRTHNGFNIFIPNHISDFIQHYFNCNLDMENLIDNGNFSASFGSYIEYDPTVIPERTQIIYDGSNRLIV